jgi:hypothetical protein
MGLKVVSRSQQLASSASSSLSLQEANGPDIHPQAVSSSVADTSIARALLV